MAKIKVELVKSVIGRPKDQRQTVIALGLGKINSVAIHDASPQIKGMVSKVSHLVAVEEVEG